MTRLPARVTDWPPEPRHDYEERAGIMQDSGIPREVAEVMAEEMTRDRYDAEPES